MRFDGKEHISLDYDPDFRIFSQAENYKKLKIERFAKHVLPRREKSHNRRLNHSLKSTWSSAKANFENFSENMTANFR